MMTGKNLNIGIKAAPVPPPPHKSHTHVKGKVVDEVRNTLFGEGRGII
jgi:hypothetical protein